MMREIFIRGYAKLKFLGRIKVFFSEIKIVFKFEILNWIFLPDDIIYILIQC